MAEPAASPQAPTAPSGVRPVEAKVVGVAAAVIVLLLAALIGVVAFLAADPLRAANIRDIVIILFAVALTLVNVAIGALMVVLVFRLQELLSFMRRELVPLMQDVSQTVRTVRGTAAFVSDQVAEPTIKIASIFAGVRQAARAANVKMRERFRRR